MSQSPFSTGRSLDYLPKEFDVLIEATRPSGKVLKVHSKIVAGEPQIKPAGK